MADYFCVWLPVHIGIYVTSYNVKLWCDKLYTLCGANHTIIEWLAPLHTTYTFLMRDVYFNFIVYSIVAVALWEQYTVAKIIIDWHWYLSFKTFYVWL